MTDRRALSGVSTLVGSIISISFIVVFRGHSLLMRLIVGVALGLIVAMTIEEFLRRRDAT